MARRGNSIRGPRSALTDFLAANNISASAIREDHDRRRQEAEQNGDVTSGPSNESAATAQNRDQVSEDEEEVQRPLKRRRSEKIAEKIKKSKRNDKTSSKKRKLDGDDEDDSAEYSDWEQMTRKAKPLPGQFANCDICDKRFTVTPYSVQSGDCDGLLCTSCGKKNTRSGTKGKGKAAGRTKRRKLESDRLDGIKVGGAKSLQRLCIEKVAELHEDIEELGDMPPSVLERLSEIFSKKRVMTSKTLPLFLRPDRDDLVVHDAAYLEERDYEHIFAVMPGVKRLVLGNACQFKDQVMNYMLSRCSQLRSIQLYAANLITDPTWNKLFYARGDELEVIKLKWLDASFDDSVVRHMVRACPNLERVKLELCRRIGADSVAALETLPKLQHLSLLISRDVPDELLVSLILRRGPQLRTLSLDKFSDADDSVLDALHAHCTRLTKLRFSDNHTATDAAYARLFTRWANPPLAFIDCSSTRSVDKAAPDGPPDPVGLASAGFRALMAHSGATLRHLDVAACRHIGLGALLDVFADGSHTYPALAHVNVSFCAHVDSCVVAGIFRSCPALRTLVAFGCFAVRDVVVPPDVALIGVPRAQDAIEQLGGGGGVDDAVARMVEVPG